VCLVWVFFLQGQFLVPVEAGETCLWPDLVQEAVAEGGCGQVLLALSSWELLSVSSGRARGLHLFWGELGYYTG